MKENNLQKVLTIYMKKKRTTKQYNEKQNCANEQSTEISTAVETQKPYQLK